MKERKFIVKNMLDDYLTPEIDKEEAIVTWWQKKRLLYNLIVGVFGLLAIGFEFVYLERSKSFLLIISPLILTFGIIVNLCFSIGKIIELFIYKTFYNLYFNDLGKLIFWMGIFFTLWFIFSLELNIYRDATSNLPPIMR